MFDRTLATDPRGATSVSSALTWPPAGRTTLSAQHCQTVRPSSMIYHRWTLLVYGLIGVDADGAEYVTYTGIYWFIVGWCNCSVSELGRQKHLCRIFL